MPIGIMSLFEVHGVAVRRKEKARIDVVELFFSLVSH